MGHPVLMGRLTYAAIGRPLPGRENVVLSRTLVRSLLPEEVRLFAEADDVRRTYGETALFVIGGAQIFREFFPDVARLLLTVVDADTGGDVFFPAWDRTAWTLVDRRRHPRDARHAYAFSIETYVRKSCGGCGDPSGLLPALGRG